MVCSTCASHLGPPWPPLAKMGNEAYGGYFSAMQPINQNMKKKGVITRVAKTPLSASAMLTGEFLQIRKVFATSSLLAEEFPDTLQYKISR